MLLRATNISKTFGRTNVLDRVGFSVHAGEIVGLIGPNGAGKTTLFEILSGLLEADSGEVSFRGQPLAPHERKQALFYLPDGIRPWPDQTVRWLLRFFNASAMTEALQLNSLTDSRISSLSKGELKRLMLAIALPAPQPLLLLDEPFDGLDFRQTQHVMNLLRAHSANGKTLFLSIHQLTDASRICDRLVLLSGGRVAGEGTLGELRMQAGVEQGGLEEVFLALT
jgi:ABC-2 type transport system ATP-binding protein